MDENPQHWIPVSIRRRAKWYNTTGAYDFAWVAWLQYLGVDIAVEVAWRFVPTQDPAIRLKKN
jgi:hypothetical protein